MERGSLRLRLIVAWALFIILTLQIAAVGLRLLFERSIMRRTVTELGLDLREIASGIEIDQNGTLTMLQRPSDPQFDTPYSGRYWQISINGKVILRSPSLWDFTIKQDGRPSLDDGNVVARVEGPDNQQMIAVVRTVAVPDGPKRTPLQVMTAVTSSEVVEETRKFSSDLLVGLAGLAAVLLLAAWAHVSVGLQPLKALSDKVAAVRSGRQERLQGIFPREVMPLVAETNALLEAQEEALDAARARAADLAHGLKTPLAVMATQSRLLRKRGETEIADEVDRQVERMRGHVERELVRVRARGARKTLHARTDVSDAIREIAGAMQLLPRSGEIAGAMQLLPRSGELTWSIDVKPSLPIAVDRADFNDIAGNLLDNAVKWASSRVHISAREEQKRVSITIEDDGAGIPAEELGRVVRRGERADTEVPGQGLGLAIVNDLVTLYGGSLDLSRGEMGGLRTRVTLPMPVAS